MTVLQAFRHRNFRIFYAGQLLSLIGTWMQTVAASWLVYRLSGSALLLGITAASQQLPMLLLSPIAGVWADRSNLQKLLVATRWLSFGQAVVLAVLSYTGLLEVWHVVVLSLFLGIVTAIETPARQSFLLDLVSGRGDLPNAIALQAMMFQAARFIGPAIAGVLLAVAGEAICFAVNAACYLGIIAAYAAIRVAPRPPAKLQRHWREDLADGFRYAFGFLGTRRLLVLLAAFGFFTAPWSSLMPIFASETFGGDSRTLGFLIGAVGIGATAATVVLAARSSVKGMGTLVGAASMGAGAMLALFSLSYSLWLSLALLCAFGFCLMVTVASTNTLLQTMADEDKRSRIIGLYAMAFIGFAPAGNFSAGALADAIGAHDALLACGVAIIACGAAFTAGLPRWRTAVRPVLQRHQEAASRDQGRDA